MSELWNDLFSGEGVRRIDVRVEEFRTESKKILYGQMDRAVQDDSIHRRGGGALKSSAIGGRLEAVDLTCSLKLMSFCWVRSMIQSHIRYRRSVSSGHRKIEAEPERTMIVDSLFVDVVSIVIHHSLNPLYPAVKGEFQFRPPEFQLEIPECQ
jgi:hypothetical protein